MKILLPLILLLTFCLNLQANTKSQIENSGKYYYGTGTSENLEEAKDIALSNLTKQIAVKVSSNFKRSLKENTKGLEESVNSVVETHSNAILKNVKTEVKETGNGLFEAFSFLEKSEVKKIFDERKKLIQTMCAEAQKNEKLGNLANSLKHYYFASILLKSIPEQNIVFEGTNYTIEIPQRINGIISGTKFQFVKSQKNSSKEKDVTLSVSYKNKPASMLDFTFWDGTNQILVQAKDGFASFRLLGESAKFPELKLRIKFAYYEARTEFSAVEELWDLVKRPSFKADKMISLKHSQQKTAPKKNSGSWNLSLKSDGKSPTKAIEKSTVSFLELISEGKKAKIRKAYANDKVLQKKILDYLKFNEPQISSPKIEAEIHPTSYGFELRKIRVKHGYASLNKHSTEFLVLDFNFKGELIDLNPSISETLYDEFVKQGEFAGDWKQRQEIIKFAEKYRMAYLTRDIATVDKMLAEEALILVGRRIKSKKLAQKYRYEELGNQPDFETIKLTKKDFIKRQNKIFKANQDIFLDFGSFEIIKKSKSKEKVYGIEMRQNYASTTYSDEGYLFLLIDFEEENPTIYVRAWQPNEWDKEAMVKTSNFRVNK